jgi:hypothetical protein
VNKVQMDEFGYDPAIRTMRRVFSHMEAASKELLAAAEISPFDPRLRRWREAARELFERGWAKAAQKNMPLTEDEAGILYGFVLKRLMEKDGILPAKLAISGKQDARTQKIMELAP